MWTWRSSEQQFYQDNMKTARILLFVVVRPQSNDSRPSSQQDIFDDVPMYIGQSNVTTAEAVGQLLVVDPEQVQNGGVEIVYL